MNREEILSHVDHTLLKPEATWPQIQTLCDEAIANHTASVCINTCYVKQAVEYMAGRIPVCCVVGFPLGAMDTASKAFEAKTAIENGAAEVDMVINIGRLKNGEYDAVREDIRAVKQAVGDKILKVIIETCLLTDDEKRRMCDIVCEAGADYIKTSTGFSTAGATFHDVELMVKGVAGRIPVCCVVGFPLGAMDTASKAFEAKTAIENGAAEVDMVINIGRLKNGEYDAVREDIRAVKQAVGDKVLKVIIETCLLTDDEKRKMCDIVCEAGADYIKTSTGFSTAGANFHDVELMVKGVAGRCKVKAAGGISTVEDMEKFLALGADRLGTSRAVKILNGEQAKGY